MDKSERLQQTRLNQLVNTYGLPRLIITGFLIFLFIMAPVAGADFPTQITNVLNRFGWNAVLVLAMVPMVILYLVFQKQFIEGIAMTGGK